MYNILIDNNNNINRNYYIYELCKFSLMTFLYSSFITIISFILNDNWNTPCIMPINIYLISVIIIFSLIYFIFLIRYLNIIRIRNFSKKINNALFFSILIYFIISYDLLDKSCLNNSSYNISLYINYSIYIYFVFYFFCCYNNNEYNENYIDFSSLPITIIDIENPIISECSICLEQYQVNQEIRLLPCEHNFHRECRKFNMSFRFHSWC